MHVEVIDMLGTAHARGKAFGAARRREIQACNSDWLNSLRTAGIGEPESYIAGMLRNTDFLTAIRQHTPDLLEEVVGIALGAEQPTEMQLAFQFMDEEWAYRQRSQNVNENRQKCSSVGILSRPGLAWIGQNMDLGGYTDGHQIVLRVAPDNASLGALIFSMGGMIALMGVNSLGVGVCVNSLPQLPVSGEGLPVAFVIRRLLQSKSATDAARVVSAIPHATGQHYLIADPTNVRSFEASPAGVAEYHSPNVSRVVHTNHPLSAQTASTGDQANSETRLRSLTDRLLKGDPDLEAIKAALSSTDDPNHPVCKAPSGRDRVSPVTGMIGFTTGSMISVLQQDSRSVDSWICAGPPNWRGYSHVCLGKTISQ